MASFKKSKLFVYTGMFPILSPLCARLVEGLQDYDKAFDCTNIGQFGMKNRLFWVFLKVRKPHGLGDVRFTGRCVSTG